MKQKIFNWFKNLGLKKVIVILASAIILLGVVTTMVLFRFKSDNQGDTKKGTVKKTITPKKSGTPTPTPSSSGSPKPSGTPSASTATPTSATSPTPPGTPSANNIYGSYDPTPIDDIENSLVLVFTDSLGDYTNPGGGEPPGGVYPYSPIDTHQIYMGVRNGRLYIKWTLGGNIPGSREVVNGNVIKSVIYNLGVDIDGDLDEEGTIDGCYGSENHLQINFSYHDNGDIWINPWYQANFIGMSGGDDGCMYGGTGGGLMHSSNGGLGKNYFIYSYALSDLLGTIYVGQNVNFDVSSEAESNIWHHYSYDQNAWNWVAWIVQGI